MIKRINFIEKKAFSFTYQKLVQICVMVVVINIFFNAYQVFKVSMLEGQMDEKAQKLKGLERQREQLLKKPVKRKVNVGEYQGLLDKVESVPSWSKLLADVARRLPNTVWITNFKSLGGSLDQGGSKKVKTKKKKASDTVQSYQLEISGLSSEMSYVTEFTTRLESSEYFRNPVLTKSNKESFGYAFTIRSDLKGRYEY